jgi:hypothetical protein
MATIGHALSNPEAGWIRYEENAWTYSAIDGIGSSELYSGGTATILPTSATAKLKFVGTSIRIIGTIYDTFTLSAKIQIDGNPLESFNCRGSAVYRALLYEKIGLTNAEHTVIITANGGNVELDAIDINSSGYIRNFLLNTVSSLNNMQIGDCIPCKYIASSGMAGRFSQLGTCKESLIPTSGIANPSGMFYFIKVDKGIAIADRVIQNNISWDTLNSKGFIEGTTCPVNLPSSTFTVTSSGVGMSATGNPHLGVSTSTRTANTGWGIYQSYNDADAIDITTMICKINKVRRISGTMDGVYLSIYLTKKDGTTIYLAIYDYDETQYWIVSGNLSIYVPKVEGITIAMSLLNSKIYINGTVYDSISKSGGVLTNRVIISHAYKDGIGGSLETDVEKCEYSRTSNMDVNLIPPVNILYCSLSGGCAFADANGNMSTTNQSKYGFPTNNEWDKYIMNSDLNGKIIKADNNVWHHNTIWSFTKETPVNNLVTTTVASCTNIDRLLRSCITTGGINALGSASISATAGYRPVIIWNESDSKATNLFY